jgi:hypothetical protein
MKRDWDVIREILLQLEQKEAANAYLSPKDFADPREQEVAYHIRLLSEAGAIEATVHESSAGDGRINGAIAKRLTWKGHELLDSIRSESIWSQVKEKFKSSGLEMTVDSVLTVAAEIVAKGLGL